MKLFTSIDSKELLPCQPQVDTSVSLESDYTELRDCVFGLCSVGTVYDAVASESLTFVNKQNIVLYNEYVNVLSKRMGINSPKQMSLESIDSDGIVIANHQISLEGWMADIWTKTKELFMKIYKTVQGFFNDYFTKLGRVKKGLDNLESVLGTTTKDLSTGGIENPPEALLKAFSGTSEVNSAYISSCIGNIKQLVSAIAGVNTAAQNFSKEGILDSDFIKNIKDLKDKALKASQDSKTNRDQKSNTSLLNRKKRSELDNENKSLQDIANSSEKKGEEMAGVVEDSGNEDTGDQEANKQKAQESFNVFLKAVIESFDKVKGKHLTDGKSVKSVGSDPEDGLKFEMDESISPSTSMVLSGKSGLTSLVKECQDLIKTAETDIKKYGQVNDAVMEAFKTIDSLVSDIDKIDPERFGKYKKVINEIVRHRLQLLRQFFTTYNKTCKNVFDMSVIVSDNTVKYAVLSLKHFE